MVCQYNLLVLTKLSYLKIFDFVLSLIYLLTSPRQETVGADKVFFRSFGRFTLVGNHTSPSIHKYLYQPITQDAREQMNRRNAQWLSSKAREMSNLDYLITEGSLVSPSHTTTSPWQKSKETLISMEHGTYIPVETSGPEKHPGSGEEEEDDEESMDWWTKYFASIDTMIEVRNSSSPSQFNLILSRYLETN